LNRMTKPFSLALVLYLIFFQLGIIPKAQSEEETAVQNRNPASQYYLEMGTENKLMMKVNVWGAVKNPGAQYVSDETDLISLLSAAGGPSEDAKLSHVRLIRNFDGENKNLVININKCLRKNEADKIPEIKPGDTVIVPKKGHSLGRFVNILYNVAVIASVVKLMTD
jgi:polysaccharide export outer membrane protein